MLNWAVKKIVLDQITQYIWEKLKQKQNFIKFAVVFDSLNIDQLFLGKE